jgi:glyoxylase-like metal-dependent hydrolase (beta-lactamase superfamily II)
MELRWPPRCSLSMAEVRGIVATHFHFDHIGGIGRLLRSCPTETRVLFHRRVKEYLRRPRVIYPGHGEVIRDGENALLRVKTLK